jgi:hypothetical protein
MRQTTGVMRQTTGVMRVITGVMKVTTVVMRQTTGVMRVITVVVRLIIGVIKSNEVNSCGAFLSSQRLISNSFQKYSGYSAKNFNFELDFRIEVNCLVNGLAAKQTLASK